VQLHARSKSSGRRRRPTIEVSSPSPRRTGGSREVYAARAKRVDTRDLSIIAALPREITRGRDESEQRAANRTRREDFASRTNGTAWENCRGDRRQGEKARRKTWRIFRGV